MDRRGDISRRQVDVGPHRKKFKRIEVASHARFLTFSCQGRLPLFANDKVKAVFVDQLAWVHQAGRVDLLAWVLMPEHVHLLVFPRQGADSIADYLRKLKSRVAKRVLKRWRELDASILNRIGDGGGAPRFWLAGGGYDRALREGESPEGVIAYIHQNPVRRGLVTVDTDWPWSSAREFAGLTTSGSKLRRFFK